MADHQKPRRGAARGNAILGDEVSGPAHRGRELDPAGRKAQLCELGSEERADLAHPGEILGRARLVDGVPQELDRALAVRLDASDQAAFRTAEACARSMVSVADGQP